MARANVFATQFHPEKSGEAGLQVYEHFVKDVAGVDDRDPRDRPAWGRAVRLLRGDPNEETAYADDPVTVAERFQEEGRAGFTSSTSTLRWRRATTATRCATSVTPLRSPCRWAAGIRALEDIGALMEAGASRAILGTAAAADPSFVSRAVEEFAERVVVAVDVRGGRVMVHGWQEEGPELDGGGRRLERRRARLATSSPRSRATARWTGPTSGSTRRS